jgi:hypothetical protein
MPSTPTGFANTIGAGAALVRMPWRGGRDGACIDGLVQAEGV